MSKIPPSAGPQQPGFPAHGRASRMATAVASGYALFGGAWVLMSDAAARLLSPDLQALHLAQRSKGLLFVGLGAAALWLVLRASAARLLRAVQQGAQSALREQDLFSAHPQPMWYYAPDTLAFLRVNAAAQQLYGWSQADFLAMTVPELRPPQERAELAQRLRGRAAGVHAVSQVRHIRRDGSTLQLRISAQTACFDGRPAVLVLAIDIGAQVAAQQALQRQEQQFRALHQSLAEVLWIASADGHTLLYMSPACDSVYGMPASAFQADAQRWLAQVHPEDRALAQQSGARLLAEGSVACQYRICRPDGQVRWLSDRKTLVRDSDGQPSLIAGIAEDITERRRDQDALRHSTTELAERYAELERFNRAAVGRELDMVALKRQVNALAHRLHQPPPYPVDAAGVPAAARALAA